MKKYLIHTILCIICSFALQTHMAYAQKNIVKANMYYNSQLYAQAIDYFVKEVAANDKATKRDAMIKLAYCYKQTGQFIEAENVYKELMKQYGKKEPIFIFEYANALRSSSKYAEAIQFFEQYKKIKPTDPLAEQCIQSCIMAEQWLVETPDYFTRLVPLINTEISDISPVLKGDTLIFSSSRKESVKKTVDLKEGGKSTMLDLFYVNLQDTTLEISNKGYLKGLNTYMHEGPATFSTDGNTVYFTRTVRGRKDKKGAPVTLQIYVSRRLASGEWSEAKSALTFNSFKYSVAHPSLSPDGKKLYFASDMPGGKGGTDIYVCEINKQGQWGSPKNLGTYVNTIGNELTPFIFNDSILYFSSDFHPGMGKKDIFIAYYKDKEWRDVENLKPPINTLANDFGFVRFPNENKGFLTSDRFNGIGREDIYSFINTEPIVLQFATSHFAIKDNSFFNTATYQLDFGENREKTDVQSDKKEFKFSFQDTSLVVLNERREGLPYNRINLQFKKNEDAYFELNIRPMQVSIRYNGYVKQSFTKDTIIQDSTVKNTLYKALDGITVKLYSKNNVIEEVESAIDGYYSFETELQSRKQYTIIAEKKHTDSFTYKGVVKNQDSENIPNAQVFLYQKNQVLDKMRASKDGEFQFRVKKGEGYRIVARAENYDLNYIDIKPADSTDVQKIRTLTLRQKGLVQQTPQKVEQEVVTVPETKPQEVKKIEKFYTVLIYESIAKRPIDVLKKEYSITDSIAVYYDANLYKYVIGKYDSLADATKFNDLKTKHIGAQVKYVVDGKFYDVGKMPKQVIVEGKIVDETQKPVQANVEFNDNETNKVVVKTESDKVTGEYKASLTEGKNYGMYISREGYIFHSENINLSDDAATKTAQNSIKKNVEMKPAIPGNSIVLNNIFFDYGKSTIRESSIPELERVVAFLQENPRLRVEISGHTCNTSSYGFNKKLSEARALSVTNYLVQKGIARNRITAIGYSYDKPIASNATEEGKQKNRRTEFKIIQ